MNKEYLRWLRAVMSDSTYNYFNTKESILGDIRSGYLRREFLKGEPPGAAAFKTIPW